MARGVEQRSHETMCGKRWTWRIEIINMVEGSGEYWPHAHSKKISTRSSRIAARRSTGSLRIAAMYQAPIS
ncbi:unnamed protein product [Urochloa humidicola]